MIRASNQFSKAIITWFQQHGRHDLPWQKNKSAYRVWLSEIMLQQTQVATVIGYFQRFLKTFPSISALANADIDEVLRLWSGLGYYARARHLHQTAKIIHEQYRGRFPQTLEQLVELPGIGMSTAGAILSLAFKKKATILDGNVKRVLARYYAISSPINDTKTQKRLWELAELETPNVNCDQYNQAMMDLGATVCTRKAPRCTQCPIQQHCQAYQYFLPSDYPVKIKRGTNPIKSLIFLLILNSEHAVLLNKRATHGIWGGLWSLPECPSDQDVLLWCQQQFNIQVSMTERWQPLIHKFTHFTLKIEPILLQLNKKGVSLASSNQVWYKPGEMLPGGIAQPVSMLLNQLKQGSIL